MSRLPTGGLIDRNRPLSFSFDGRALSGFAGDTLASALLANDVRLVGRSFKYHRPRGIVTAGAEEPNALVTLRAGARAEPNARTTTTELYDGLIAQSQNRWPSLGFDLLALNNILSPLFPAGFYYKTFMWPAQFWERLYEPIIRRAAGLGALSGKPDPDLYDAHHAFCDVLVIGAGPAGIAAAIAASRSGARVLLVEDDFRLGGRLLAERHEIDGAPSLDWLGAAEAELSAAPNVRILTRTNLFAAFDSATYAAIERVSDHLPEPAPNAPRQRLWKIVAKQTILATGAYERHLVFGGNDRPGVMNAAAVQAYVNRFGAAPGERIAIYTTTDSGWTVANDLLVSGINVAAIIDARAETAADTSKARAAGVRVLTSSLVASARGAPDLHSFTVIDANGAEHDIFADTLAMAGGWSPNFAIASHRGARPVWDEARNVYLMPSQSGMSIIGAARARFTLAECLSDGFAAGATAANDLGFATSPTPSPRVSDDPAGASPLWKAPRKRGKAFVDFQHDVTDSDVALAAREGYLSVEHMKRYTTLGMATDQGKTSQVIGNALLADATGKSINEIGTIIARPPASPVAIGALAGHHRGENFRPVRHTQSHCWAKARGALFVDAGLWKRAQYYPIPGETDWLETVTREARHVRAHVGVCDVSTLGKIDVLGPDAGALLDRIYTNTFSQLAVGKARYGLMLREDGFVFDDGTTTRLAEDRYFVTTTTANAARVMQHIDYCRQVLWPELDVQAISTTEQWAQYAIAGPQSRALLESLLPGEDLSNQALPYMGARELAWRGAPMRLFRLSFSGELGYEIATPAAYGDALLRAIMEAGAPFNVAPYGTEALSVLRIEKGHVAGGELSGQTTATDLGLTAMLSKKKDFIGRAMAERAALTSAGRPQLVGLKPLDTKARLRAGAHIVPVAAPNVAANDQGYVTSVAYSPACGSWIGLALVKNGRARHGERVRAYDPVRSGDIAVELCAPVFVDPAGERLRG